MRPPRTNPPQTLRFRFRELPAQLTRGERLVVVLVYSAGAAMCLGMLAGIAFHAYAGVAPAIASMVGVIVGFLALLAFLLALILATLWGYRP